VETTRIRVASDVDFTDVVLSQDFPGSESSYTSVLSPDSDTYHWQVTAEFYRPGAGATSLINSQVTSFGIDTVLPTSAVGTIFLLSPGYVVTWQGQDILSGVVAYDVEYRADGAAVWVSWLRNTTATVHVFTPPIPGQIYWFRTQAKDAAGNVEPVLTNAVRNTGQAVPFSHSMIMPLIIVE